MENETKPEETKPEETKPELIAQAEAAAKRLEDANKKQEEILIRQEKLFAMQRLGGKTEAGQLAEKPKELTPEEYAEKVYKGEINPFKV